MLGLELPVPAPALLHELAIFLTLVTVQDWPALELLVPELALEEPALDPAALALAGLPLTRTSCPTCLLSCALSPWS